MQQPVAQFLRLDQRVVAIEEQNAGPGEQVDPYLRIAARWPWAGELAAAFARLQALPRPHA